MTVGAWLAAHVREAPAALRDRVAALVQAEVGPVEEVLAAAALRALGAVRAAPGTRAVALDLLAADALVTLALQARAERAPAGLVAFARGLRDAGAALP